MKSFKKLFFVLILLSTEFAANAQFNYNIVDYGAVKNDTSRLSTNAINKAIAACFAAGGGRVFIPSGNFKSGTIILKNNVELYLDRGAVLYASTSHKDFPRQRQPAYRSQKDPGGWFALIYAEGAENIGISGKGTIDGQGTKQMPRPELPGEDRDGRPRSILFVSCKGISVDGISMQSSGIWNQHYLNCEDVIVNNIRVYNHSNKHNDAIDIDGCRRFILSNSIMDTDDDGITLKSTGPAGCEDVAITNCIVSSYTNAIKCGTESTGGFRNITISNCTIKPSISNVPSMYKLPRTGITAISLEIVDGGIMDGVNISNIVIDGTECPIYVRLGNRARKHHEDAPVPPKGQMRNIQISNINAYNSGNYCSSITGVPGAVIENISLSNIRLVNKGGLKDGQYLADVTKVKEDEKGYPEPTVWKNLPSYAFFIRHVKNISLSGISLKSLNPESRPALIGADIEKILVRDFNVDSDNSNKKEKINFQFHEVRTYEVDQDRINIL